MSFYLRKTGKRVAKYGFPKFEFWMEILPQAATRFESLKHVLVATALQDELLTSPTSIPIIERRIDYHYEQALRKTAYCKPVIENVLLNCLGMFYLESLRNNTDLIGIHLDYAKKIIDEWRTKKPRATLETHSLIDLIEEIVFECRIYITMAPDPPLLVHTETNDFWKEHPRADSFESPEDAEHGLIACLSNLSRASGQSPVGLVRTNAVLDQWNADCRDTVAHSEISVVNSTAMTALFHIAKQVIVVLDRSSQESSAERWNILLEQVRDYPTLRSARSRKPIAAVIQVLQQASTMDTQRTAIVRLQKHIQRAVVYGE